MSYTSFIILLIITVLYLHDLYSASDDIYVILKHALYK